MQIEYNYTMSTKIIYVCNCCGKEDINIMLMEQIEKGNRTLHKCIDCRRKSEKKYIPVSEFKFINKYDIIVN